MWGIPEKNYQKLAQECKLDHSNVLPAHEIERINKDMQLILYSPEYLGQHTEGRYIADIRLQTNK